MSESTLGLGLAGGGAAWEFIPGPGTGGVTKEVDINGLCQSSFSRKLPYRRGLSCRGVDRGAR